MEVIEESRSHSSSDEIEAYFNDLDKRFQSKVTLIERKISDINKIDGDIFNLNSFEKNDYLIEKLDSRNKHSKKKRKKSLKRKNNRSRSVLRRSTSRSAISSSENKIKNDAFNFYDTRKNFDKQNIEFISDESLKKSDSGSESNIDKTSKRPSLEAELGTLPNAEKSPIVADKMMIDQKKSFYQYNSIKQYDNNNLKEDYNFNNYYKLTHASCVKNNEYLNLKKNKYKPVNFIYSESNSIKNEIELSVSNLSKCLEKNSGAKNGHLTSNSMNECVLGELINKNISKKNTETETENIK